jgi:hypothetical protein
MVFGALFVSLGLYVVFITCTHKNEMQVVRKEKLALPGETRVLSVGSSYQLK